MKMIIAAFLLAGFVFTGCANLQEAGKIILGTSVQAMEKARVNADKKTYRCDFDSCYDAVLDLSRERQDSELRINKGAFDVYAKNPIKGYIVVMGVEGNIDTTEVGVFFVELGDRTTRVEVSSASTSAKETVSEAVFKELDSLFSKAD